jgi:hypothetical protein
VPEIVGRIKQDLEEVTKHRGIETEHWEASATGKAAWEAQLPAIMERVRKVTPIYEAMVIQATQ